jgi:hypothetical protein
LPNIVLFDDSIAGVDADPDLVSVVALPIKLAAR